MAIGEKRKQKEQEAETAAWQTTRERIQWFLTRAESFTGVTNAEDASIPVQLHQGEHALLVLPSASLVEPRHLPGHWLGGNTGFSFRVARGVHYRVGATKGHYQQGAEEPTVVDTGTATVTDRRVVFSGTRAAHEWEYAKVLGFHNSDDPPWTAIPVSGRDKVAGVRYDPSHTEAFRFSLTLGLARFHGDSDSLLSDLRHQLEEVDADRPMGIPPEVRPGVVDVPSPVEASTPAPAAAAPSAQPAPSPVQPAATPEPAATAATALPAAGWYHDPYGAARLRWWDGREWTGHTAP